MTIEIIRLWYNVHVKKIQRKRGINMQLKHNFEISKQRKVRINILTDYRWGEDTNWDSTKDNSFRKYMKERFNEFGLNVEESKNHYICDRLQGDDYNIYMHPKAFTGYATEDVVNTILKVLKSCPMVYQIDKPILSGVYLISDEEYKNIMRDNIIDILEWIRQYKKTHKMTYNIGFDFAKETRIPRVNQGSCYTSSDVDVVFIDSIMHSHTFNKENKKNKKKSS